MTSSLSLLKALKLQTPLDILLSNDSCHPALEEKGKKKRGTMGKTRRERLHGDGEDDRSPLIVNCPFVYPLSPCL